MVEPFLEGMTFEEAMKNKKIYIVNLKKLSDVMCRFNRVVSDNLILATAVKIVDLQGFHSLTFSARGQLVFTGRQNYLN